ncbi:hypothetical protein SRHO_G00186240 [Serrasalmus rhombeus]
MEFSGAPTELIKQKKEQQNRRNLQVSAYSCATQDYINLPQLGCQGGKIWHKIGKDDISGERKNLQASSPVSWQPLP